MINAPIPIDKELLSKVARLAMEGLSQRAIAKELGYSHVFIQKVFSKEEFQDEVRRAIRNKLVQLAGRTGEVLEDALKEGSLEAVKIIYKSLAVLDPEPTSGKIDQSLTIVLPGGLQHAEKEVVSEASESSRVESNQGE